MSFRTKRVIISTPFYMIFEFFLLKYTFLLLGLYNNICVIILTLLIGMLRLVPMFFESKNSTAFCRVLANIDGVWMWTSLMFLIDILIIYLLGMFIPLSFEINGLLLIIVPILGIYNYYKAHKLVVNEKTLKLENLARDINIVHLSDVHFGSVRHKEIIHQIADKLIEAIKSNKYDFLRCNFPNGDMVGHTGNFNATVKGVEAVDENIGRLMKACTDNDYILLVIADHGNAEEMIDDKGKVKTSHTTNPVPFIIYGNDISDIKFKRGDFGLANLAIFFCISQIFSSSFNNSKTVGRSFSDVSSFLTIIAAFLSTKL